MRIHAMPISMSFYLCFRNLPTGRAGKYRFHIFTHACTHRGRFTGTDRDRDRGGGAVTMAISAATPRGARDPRHTHHLSDGKRLVPTQIDSFDTTQSFLLYHVPGALCARYSARNRGQKRQHTGCKQKQGYGRLHPLRNNPVAEAHWVPASVTRA